MLERHLGFTHSRDCLQLVLYGGGAGCAVHTLNRDACVLQVGRALTGLSTRRVALRKQKLCNRAREIRERRKNDDGGRSQPEHETARTLGSGHGTDAAWTAVAS